ncbi:MAG: Holliday junction resolvase RuvX, partial [Gammaproteobacteria bacterium]
GLPDQDQSGVIRAGAENFAAALKSRYLLPLDMVAEHLTSFAAESELKESRRHGQKARRVKPGEVDAVAARLIAEQWLNEQEHE